MLPFRKFPLLLDSYLEVFNIQDSDYVDSFYKQLINGLLDWAEEIIAINKKYADIVKILNYTFLLESLRARGIVYSGITDTENRNETRRMPPSVNSFLRTLVIHSQQSFRGYTAWMVSYEFPNVSYIIERMNHLGSRANDRELTLFMRRQNIIDLSKSLSSKCVEVSIYAMYNRLKKHFSTPGLSTLHLKSIIWRMLEDKLIQDLKRIHEGANTSFHVSFLSIIDTAKSIFRKVS